MTGPAAPLLEVTGVSVRFGALIAVNRVSLSIAQREIVAIIGPNGAGTTTLRHGGGGRPCRRGADARRARRGRGAQAKALSRGGSDGRDERRGEGGHVPLHPRSQSRVRHDDRFFFLKNGRPPGIPPLPLPAALRT